MKKLFTLFVVISSGLYVYAQITDSGNGFKETFDYPDGTVYDSVTYEDGLFIEWPENSTVEGGVLTWDQAVEGETSFGGEFDDSLNLTDNPTLSFKYQFPIQTDLIIYVSDAAGGEGELAPTYVAGADSLLEVTVDLSTVEGADISKLTSFYIIPFTPVAGTLYLDDVLLGDAELEEGLITDPITESGNGFAEPFDYPDGTVYDSVTYLGAFMEWPADVGALIEDGKLKWEQEVEGEASFGGELDSAMDLTGHVNMQFKYQFPIQTEVVIYLADADGGEGELIPTTVILGTDTLQEITIDLSKVEGADISKLTAFYIITFTPTAGILYLDDVMLGDAIMATGINNYFLQNDFRIYPNPATTDFRIDVNAELVSIFNTAGQVVYSEKNYKKGASINIDGLNSGLYFVKADETIRKLIVR